MDAVIGLVFGLACLGLVGGLVALAVVGVSRASKRRIDREQSLAGYAAAREWRFTTDGTGLSARFSGAPFGQGDTRQSRNVVEGTFVGRPFVAFDYSYVSHTTDSDGNSNSSTQRYSVVAMHLGLQAPDLSVSPQGSFGRFFSNLLGTDLEVGDPAFDDRFHVRTSSEPFARDVLVPALTGWLAAYQDRAWRITGDQLLMFRSGQHSPGEIDGVLAQCVALLDRVPPHVWSKLRGQV